MLQDALGLSYQQTYRILHGYASRGMTYSGLLEKCPAISYLDTTITEDCEGYAVRRREHLFLFDRETYRRWARGGEVWIDEGGDRDDGPGPDRDDTFSISARFQQNFSTCREDQKTRDGPETDSTSTDRETRLSLSTTLQQNTHPHSALSPPASGCAGGCDIRDAENDPLISPLRGDNPNRPPSTHPLNFSTFRKLLKTAERKGPTTLPGVLDHREFTRTKTDLGRCSVCDEGRAVFRSRDGRALLCEGCYARLVQTWNEKKGLAR